MCLWSSSQYNVTIANYPDSYSNKLYKCCWWQPPVTEPRSWERNGPGSSSSGDWWLRRPEPVQSGAGANLPEPEDTQSEPLSLSLQQTLQVEIRSHLKSKFTCCVTCMLNICIGVFSALLRFLNHFVVCRCAVCSSDKWSKAWLWRLRLSAVHHLSLSAYSLFYWVK